MALQFLFVIPGRAFFRREPGIQMLLREIPGSRHPAALRAGG
jgi:hypothetical protein